MKTTIAGLIDLRSTLLLFCLASQFGPFLAQANPTGGTIAQGTATFANSGSQLTINQTSANAYINWQSFNIAAGETTTFLQPSSTSLAWNQINDPNPSQILGNLNANGYVVLQNSSGFVIGGQAAITAHGLVMTTASGPTLTSGGAWEFDAPPVSAQIINYGQINITGGGTAYLIASDIENDGTISAPNGSIGLYAGQKVLVSMSPNGLGLSAQVTLPQGSVDNNGHLIADAGSIAAQAQYVNQNGLVQANSVQNVNGTIELVASDSVNLGAHSAITAKGDSSSVSAGGSVTIQSANNFSDQAGSLIDVSGSAQGGAGGQVAISAPQMSLLQSTINGQAISGYANAALSINTADITLNGDGSPVTGQLALNVNALSPGISQLDLQASGSIEVSSLLSLTPQSGVLNMVSLIAGGTLTVDAGAGIGVNGGKIYLSANTVSQNGMLQANSVQNANGTVELVASDSVNLGAHSAITAKGDSSSVSAGGSVTIQSANNFSDQAGSLIDVSGSAQGGAGGQVAISAPQMSLLQSTINGQAISGYANAALSINTADITLNGDGSPVTGQLALNVNALSPGISQLDLQASGSIEVSSLLSLTPQSGVLNMVSLIAGGTLTVDAGAGIGVNGGKIYLSANTVSQNGMLQANYDLNANGVIEIDANNSLTLGATSQIDANGESTAISPGGIVVLKSGNTYADTPTSQINVSGQRGGQNGIIEIFGNNLDGTLGNTLDANSVQSSIGNSLVTLINPHDITLSLTPTAVSYNANNNNLDANFNLNDLAPYLQIDLQALGSIELGASWNLVASAIPASLSLTAGDNVTLDSGADLTAGNNWSVNLAAGTGFAPTTLKPQPDSGSDGIYLNDNSYIQAQNGNITLYAANEVQIAADANAGSDGIRTLNGGNIAVTAQYGDVNAGANPDGYQYEQAPSRHGSFLPPYYSVSDAVGGISTAAGGNVTITAGGNVISYLPGGTTVGADAGTGAFGSKPGNVTITAGGNVYGHYVVADGTGIITAGKSVGTISGVDAFALSLVAGSWSVYAPNGNINLQEVRNPRGDFDNVSYGSVAAYTFDYSAQASVTLDAGLGVDLTDQSVPRLSSAPQDQVPVIYPPILDISAGSGGVTLQGNVTLFPSIDQSLNITTTDNGGLVSAPNTPGTTPELLMSDSSQTSWSSANNAFSDTDNSIGLPVQAGDPNPVIIHISGNMENIDLITSKATQLTVDGDMIGSGFSGQNLHASDVTSITVGGQIYSRGPYDFVYGINDIPSVPATDLLPDMGSSWENIFTLAVNPAAIANLKVPAGTLDSQLAGYALTTSSLFGVSKLSNGQLQGNNPGFVYDQVTGQFGFAGDMSSLPSSVLKALTAGSITILHLVNDLAVVDTNPGDDSPGRTYGQLETDTVTWVNPAAIGTLYTASLGAPSPTSSQLGYRVGGPGLFTVNASSIDLGNTYGIISGGVYDPQGGYDRYADLASITPSGATVDVTVNADQTGTVVVDGTTIAPHDSLSMLTSTIAAIGGGNVNVTSTGGSMDLGSEDLFGNETRDLGFGVYTSGNGDVNVTAENDIDIDGSRIASYNGGNISIVSLQGNVDAGDGGAAYIQVPVAYVDPADGEAQVYREAVFGSGIVADTLIDPSQVPDSAVIPGNVTVETFQGDINANLGGILQEALDGNVSAGPTITLVAGTASSGTFGQPGYSPGYGGNINLGQAGAIGGTVNATAYGTQPNGNINGLVISRQNSDINAAQNFSGAVLSGGSANVSGGGTVSGIIVGVTGANVTGAGGVSAQVLSQNANVGGVAQNTLGATATATATSQSASGQASSDSKQELASNETGTDDDEKKKQKMHPLIRRIKRVTVILPKT